MNHERSRPLRRGTTLMELLLAMVVITMVSVAAVRWITIMQVSDRERSQRMGAMAEIRRLADCFRQSCRSADRVETGPDELRMVRGEIVDVFSRDETGQIFLVGRDGPMVRFRDRFRLSEDHDIAFEVGDAGSSARIVIADPRAAEPVFWIEGHLPRDPANATSEDSP